MHAENYYGKDELVHKTEYILEEEGILKEKQKRTFFVYTFPQTWESSCLGFDICKDGSPAVGADSLVKACTTVVYESNTKTYAVFFENEICYVVQNITNDFIEDLLKKNMAPLSKAIERYKLNA